MESKLQEYYRAGEVGSDSKDLGEIIYFSVFTLHYTSDVFIENFIKLLFGIII